MFGKRLDSEIGDKSVQMTSFSTKVSSSSDVIDEKFYEKTIRASALKSDFEILPGGDSTEIGEKVTDLFILVCFVKLKTFYGYSVF